MEGGSMLVYAIPKTANIDEYKHILNNDKYNLSKNFKNDIEVASIETLQRFSNNIKKNIKTLKDFITIEKNKGKKIAAWGAGQRGISLINLCNLNKNDLEYVVDVKSIVQWIVCSAC